MKAKGWFVSALIAGGALFSVKTMGGCLNKAAPDQELAGRLDDLCEIARDGAAKPEAGVRALGRYMVKHTGDLLGSFGDTIALIERVPDDEAHDERARLARERIQKPLVACEADWQRFGEAIEADPKASALVDKAMIRLNRTIEILVGNQRLTLRGLPQELERLLDAAAR
ncbi:MAG: hypothetical protein IPQ07_24260 [Myxococcales bacterium]|nr:hypothetical protein [Myxococcales bacterium]